MEETSDTSLVNSRLQPLVELQAENLTLKEELERLRIDRQTVLDHSIKSDQRLLQFTENIFEQPPSLSAYNKGDFSGTCSSKIMEVQAEQNHHLTENLVAKDELEKARLKVKELEEQIAILTRPCEICNILTEETRNMIASLKSLEAENAQLKNRLSAEPSTPTLASPRTSQPVLQLHNKFDILMEKGNQVTHDDNGFVMVSKKKKNRKRRKTSNSGNPKLKNGIFKQKIDPTSNMTIPFKNVSIIGDSHVRNLASLMRRQVRAGCMISGVCKPGAGLLDMKPSSTPPPDHCYVLMAGTNDIGAGRKDVIFKHMEEVLQSCSKSSRVLAITLPTRHDLDPNNPLHHTIRLVNNYIAELCRRYEGVEMLDISKIARKHFTRHGLHLQAIGKRFLARLVVEKLAFMKPTHGTRPSQDTLPAAPAASPLPAVSALPYETYAEAVKVTQPHYTSHDLHPPENSLPCRNSIFLGKPFPADGQN